MIALSASLLLTTLLSAFGAQPVAACDTPPNSCNSSFFNLTVPGAQVLNITAVVALNTTSNVTWCDVKVNLTHPGDADNVLVETWLPLTADAWNGRFQATGGGGFMLGYFNTTLKPAMEKGWAVSSTDGGHAGNTSDARWALDPDSTINWGLMHNFATRSSADMVIVGKAVTEQYYGQPAHHSYWNGCSTGGRQGFDIAQRYPDLLDGIFAGSPAVNEANLIMGDFWPQVVMKEAALLVTNCQFDTIRNLTIKACDLLDGVADGIVEDLDACAQLYDPLVTVGQIALCNGIQSLITAPMVNVVKSVWKGPATPFGSPIGHGLSLTAKTNTLANITVGLDGTAFPRPFSITNAWLQIVLLKNPLYNTATLTYNDFMALWTQSVEQLGWLINNGDPFLHAFRDSGGKLLSWHGTSDTIIPHTNTLQYRERVEMVMGGPDKVNEFFRLFLAPGVDHCGGGVGPIPVDPMKALVDWVEKGRVPERLYANTTNAANQTISRDLCPYPSKNHWGGMGDGLNASSWNCIGGNTTIRKYIGG